MPVAPFGPRTVAWLVGAAAVSLAVALSLTVFGGGDAIRSARADSFSPSAIGHRAFLELLRRWGVPVVVSRHSSAARAKDAALLVAVEPRLAEDDAESATGSRVQRMAFESPRMLLVLPKWEGEADRARAGRIASVRPVPAGEVDKLLAAVGVDARIVRLATDGPLACDAPLAPTLARPQLLLPGPFTPLVTCPGGILLAERRVGPLRTLVLSDPDLLANHGLGRGDNAALLRWVLDRARDSSSQPVVLDETLHGYDSAPSLARELLRSPLSLAVSQGLLALAVLVFAGLRRFGPPLPPAPALAPGKGLLIENTALLLRQGGHSIHTLARYLDSTSQDVARAL